MGWLPGAIPIQLLTILFLSYRKELYASLSSPLFKLLNIIKLHDLVTLHIAIFMFKFHNHLLPSVFNTYFTAVDHIHKYNTGSAAGKSYYLPRARTNYGKFNIRFQGSKIWNSIAEDVKSLSLRQFEKKISKTNFLNHIDDSNHSL